MLGKLGPHTRTTPNLTSLLDKPHTQSKGMPGVSDPLTFKQAMCLGTKAVPPSPKESLLASGALNN